MSTAKNIHEAVLEVYKKVGYVQKTGTNSFHKYRYASEADLIEALRPAMLESGIIVHPAGIVETPHNPGYFSATFMYDFIHATSGTVIRSYVRGEAADVKGDKAAYKASTGAYKYALRQTFMIETGDDPDNESPDITQKTTKAKKGVTFDPENLKKDVIERISKANTAEELRILLNKHYKHELEALNKTQRQEIIGLFSKRKEEIINQE